MNEKITAHPQKEEREKVLKEIQQLENRKKILENKQRNEERRVRTRRLIERGDRKSTRLNSSHRLESRMPSSA